MHINGNFCDERQNSVHSELKMETGMFFASNVEQRVLIHTDCENWYLYK